MNTVLRLRYIGTRYHGWQRQKKLITVQETLETALGGLLSEKITVTGCGRTDAGVHAEKYAANFRSERLIPLDKLPLALNARLPEDIAVMGAWPAEEDFHAVFSARRKEYAYRIYNSRIKDPFYINRAHFVPAPLNVEAMASAAEKFLGEHDFASMRSVGTNVKTTVRTVYSFEVSKSGDIIELRICASGFLYNMARAMSGTVLYAGLGKLEPGDITGIIEGRNRSFAGPTLPPGGLYMTDIVYDEPLRSAFNAG